MNDTALSAYIFIPEHILARAKLSLIDKVVYGLVIGLTKKEGYCYATNEWISQVLGVSIKSVSRSVTELVEQGLLTRKLVTKDGKVIGRKLFAFKTPEETDESSMDSESSMDLKSSMDPESSMDPKSGHNNLVTSNLVTKLTKYTSYTKETSFPEGSDSSSTRMELKGSEEQVGVPPSYSKNSEATSHSKQKKDKKPKAPKELWQTPYYLDKIPDEDITYFSEKFGMTEQQIRKSASGYKLWLEGKGILWTYKNYKAVLEGSLQKKADQANEQKQEIKAMESPATFVPTKAGFDDMDIDSLDLGYNTW